MRWPTGQVREAELGREQMAFDYTGKRRCRRPCKPTQGCTPLGSQSAASAVRGPWVEAGTIAVGRQRREKHLKEFQQIWCGCWPKPRGEGTLPGTRWGR